MDRNGYPEESELQKIREWPGDKTNHLDTAALLAYVRERWTYEYWIEEGDLIRASTGGWSGNESLIQALQENAMFWTLCWLESRRGGYYTFQRTHGSGLHCKQPSQWEALHAAV